MRTITELKLLSPACPEQHSGKLDTGEELYIRVRHGTWRFELNGVEIALGQAIGDGMFEDGELASLLAEHHFTLADGVEIERDTEWWDWLRHSD